MIACPTQPEIYFHGLNPIAIVRSHESCPAARQIAGDLVSDFYSHHERHLHGTIRFHGIRYQVSSRYGTRREDGRYGDELNVLDARATGGRRVRVYEPA